MIRLALLLAALPAQALDLPEPPDLAPLAAFVERPVESCNAADLYLQAEELYRKTEFSKPRDQRQTLAADHPCMELVLRGLRCRRCVFPYSLEMTLPPTDQLIPMSALYWAASKTFVGKGRELMEQAGRDQAKLEAAREEFHKALTLGIHLHEEPGLTFIQDMISLRVLSDAAEGLGDLAIAMGREDDAVICTRFLVRSRRYLEGITRFIREELDYTSLARAPRSQGVKVLEIAGVYDATTNRAVQVEILMYLGLAYPLVDDPEAERAAREVFQRASQDPDLRIQRLADWAAKLDRKMVRKQVEQMAGAPLPD